MQQFILGPFLASLYYFYTPCAKLPLRGTLIRQPKRGERRGREKRKGIGRTHVDGLGSGDVKGGDEGLDGGGRVLKGLELLHDLALELSDGLVSGLLDLGASREHGDDGLVGCVWCCTGSRGKQSQAEAARESAFG